MANPKKPPDVRQRTKDGHRDGDIGLVVVPLSPGMETPPPPKHWLAQTKRWWEAFWVSPLAQLVIPADLPALCRLHDLYDFRERAATGFRKRPLTEGSQGQSVLNPLAAEMHADGREITTLEDRFGITPMARLKLGVKFGEARQALADSWDQGDDLVEDDPRLRVIDVGVAESGG